MEKINKTNKNNNNSVFSRLPELIKHTGKGELKPLEYGEISMEIVLTKQNIPPVSILVKRLDSHNYGPV